MLMSREMISPGINIQTGIEYITAVLSRNGYTATHIGEGILLVTWPPAVSTIRETIMSQAEARAEHMPEPQSTYQMQMPAVPAHTQTFVSADQIQGAKDTMSNLKRIVARYKQPGN
jgi:hypothetical protein